MKSSSADDGGKKSLSNSDKKTVDISPKKIRLHCFPDISVQTSPVNPGCTNEKGSFKRIHFDSGKVTCSDTCEHKGDHDLHGHSSSIPEVEARAFQKGYAEGQRASLDSQREEVASAVQSMRQAIVEIQSVRQEIYHSIEREVVGLALAIARKVVCQEIKIDPDVVVCVAREALSQVDVPGKIKIRLNPADLEFITSTQGQISEFLKEMDNVTVEAEQGITSGGCLIETNLGEIDARIEKQFQVVEDKFHAEFARSQQQNNSDDNS